MSSVRKKEKIQIDTVSLSDVISIKISTYLHCFGLLNPGRFLKTAQFRCWQAGWRRARVAAALHQEETCREQVVPMRACKQRRSNGVEIIEGRREVENWMPKLLGLQTTLQNCRQYRRPNETSWNIMKHLQKTWKFALTKNKMKPTNPNADTYVDKQRQYLFVTFPTNSFVRHPEFTHWGDTLVGHPCLTLLSNSCLTLLWDTLVRHFLLDTLVRHSYLTFL